MPWMDRFARYLARHSHGLRLAVDHGPMSGAVLEYACKNSPQGSNAIARAIDRRFLNLETNIGDRERVTNTKGLVAEVLQRRRSAKLATTILDVASGTAPYLRQLAIEQAGNDLTIVCHDRSPRQVMFGRDLVDAEGQRRITFAVGDATDQASYLTRHDPDIILAVHLFPYLQKDADVQTVIKLAYDHLRPKGCLICTTLSKPPGGSAYWSADAFGKRPTSRPPELLKSWLNTAGFVAIDQRASQLNGFALLGWKAEKL